MIQIRTLNIAHVTQEEYDHYYSIATPAKREKIDRYRQENDRKRSLAGEILAKRMIMEYYAQRDVILKPEDIILRTTEKGKPYAEGLDIHFNISHSGEYAACAVSDCEIGIDIEKICTVKESLIRYVCNDNESEYVRNDPQRFFRIWTAKEAYFKCIGTGITDIRSVDVIEKPEGFCFETSVEGEYVLSVCTKKDCI